MLLSHSWTFNFHPFYMSFNNNFKECIHFMKRGVYKSELFSIWYFSGWGRKIINNFVHLDLYNVRATCQLYCVVCHDVLSNWNYSNVFHFRQSSFYCSGSHCNVPYSACNVTISAGRYNSCIYFIAMTHGFGVKY